jgi:hypothetical protein
MLTFPVFYGVLILTMDVLGHERTKNISFQLGRYDSVWVARGVLTMGVGWVTGRGSNRAGRG